MRSYRTDSPHAAARIVALALIADGHVSPAELQCAHLAGAQALLRIDPGTLQEVIRTLCEDLLATTSGDWAAACRLDEDDIGAILDEVRDPLLQLQVLQACLAAVLADGHVSDGESTIVRAALARWGLGVRWPKPLPRAA
jgi:hypothetical protein